MEFLAFYLPQFHEIPENNDAWGNGFTEWVNVKSAKKYYEWQRQPREPLYGYYNLLNPKVIEMQAKLSKKYGIDGFVFYHYWFNGRLVLEKPVEILRNSTEIDQRYCFCWANEPWTKTWHGAGGNKEIMIAQKYGGIDEWKKHYEYFRPYFMDSRYIKKEGKPVIIIYKLRNITDFNHMIECWNRLAKNDGFDGVYIISMNVTGDHAFQSKWVDASVDFEPNRTKYELSSHSNADERIIDYDSIYESMIERPHKKNHYRTVFVDYDDTPRRKDKGVLCKNVSSDKFEKYLRGTVHKSILENNDYVFLNAWNEWGESNYLEPDVTYGDLYLSIVHKIKEELKNYKNE